MNLWLQGCAVQHMAKIDDEGGQQNHYGTGPGAHQTDHDELRGPCVDEQRHADRLPQRKAADAGQGSEDDAERRDTDQHGHTVAKAADIKLIAGHGFLLMSRMVSRSLKAVL